MSSMVSFFAGFRISSSYDKDRSDRVIRSNPIRLTIIIIFINYLNDVLTFPYFLIWYLNFIFVQSKYFNFLFLLNHVFLDQ